MGHIKKKLNQVISHLDFNDVIDVKDVNDFNDVNDVYDVNDVNDNINFKECRMTNAYYYSAIFVMVFPFLLHFF